jgi:hypothetical protein
VLRTLMSKSPTQTTDTALEKQEAGRGDRDCSRRAGTSTSW